MLLRLAPLFAIACMVLTAAPGGGRALAAQGPSLAVLRANGAAEIQDVYIRPPATDFSGQVLVALHGMGGNGPDFAAPLAAQADANGWLIVAPTISYGDWTNP